jgi:UDP-N-acetyl-D-galactosamine dehydrogenase
VDAAEARHEYGIDLITEPALGEYQAVIIAVGHDRFRDQGAQGLRALCSTDGVLYDVKYLLPADAVDGRL